MTTRYIQLIAFILLGTLNSHAQTTKIGASNVGLIFSPNYSCRTIKAPSEHQSIKDSRDENESAIFGFSGGVSYQYALRFGLTLETGAYFTRKGYRYGNIPVTTSPDPLLSVGTMTNWIYHDFMDIPVKVGYSGKISERIRLFGNAGASFGFLGRNRYKQVLRYGNGIVNVHKYQSSSQSVNTVNIDLMLSAGVDIEVLNRFAVRVEPTFRHSVTPSKFGMIYGLEGIKEYTYSVGANVGVIYRFK